MPRKARIVVKNTPHHIVQRGHNGAPVFFEEKDYEVYLKDLATFKKQFKCKVHSYCLLENEIHLIVNPGNDEKSLGLLLKRLGGRYTRYVNKTYDKRGTVWEGRYKSSPIEKETYLLKSELYVDSKAKIKNIVKDSFDYKWSSALIKSGQKNDELGVIDTSKEFLSQGSSEEEAKKAYFARLFDDLKSSDINFIENAIQRSQLTGTPDFVNAVEKKTGERIETRGQGRPRTPSSIKTKEKIKEEKKVVKKADLHKFIDTKQVKEIIKEATVETPTVTKPRTIKEEIALKEKELARIMEEKGIVMPSDEKQEDKTKAPPAPKEEIKAEKKIEEKPVPTDAPKKKSPFSRMAFLSLKQDVLQLKEDNSIYTETAYKNLINQINDIEKTLINSNIKDGQNLIAKLVADINLKRGKELNDNASALIADGVAPLIAKIASLKG